jgi:methionyl aminopeptidase
MIKSKKEIELIKDSGKIVSEVLKTLALNVKEGITPIEIDTLCKAIIEKHNSISACLNYYGFPSNICISVNDIAIHGIPNKIPFKNGDLVKLDLVVKKNGYMADSAITVGVGNLTEKAKNLKEVTEKALYSTIYEVKPNISIKDMVKPIKQITSKHGYGIIKEYCGHGIGSEMHEEPYIVHDPDYAIDFILKPGMVICIEPMITEGSPKVKVLDDGWSVSTLDGGLSAHFEHTVLVTDNGYEVLTL